MLLEHKSFYDVQKVFNTFPLLSCHEILSQTTVNYSTIGLKPVISGKDKRPLRCWTDDKRRFLKLFKTNGPKCDQHIDTTAIALKARPVFEKSSKTL